MEILFSQPHPGCQWSRQDGSDGLSKIQTWDGSDFISEPPYLTMIIIPGLRGFSFTVGSAEKNPRRVTFMRFHLRETAFVSFKVKVEGEGEHAQLASLGGYSDFDFFSPQSTPNRASVSSGERSPSPFASPPKATSRSLLGEKSPENFSR